MAIASSCRLLVPWDNIGQTRCPMLVVSRITCTSPVVAASIVDMTYATVALWFVLSVIERKTERRYLQISKHNIIKNSKKARFFAILYDTLTALRALEPWHNTRCKTSKQVSVSVLITLRVLEPRLHSLRV